MPVITRLDLPGRDGGDPNMSGNPIDPTCAEMLSDQIRHLLFWLSWAVLFFLCPGFVPNGF